MKAAVRVYAAPWPGHEGGRRLLARALEREGRSWAEPERRPDGGKPFLPGFPFNLSHSGDWSVCAVGPAELGVDLQAERPLRRDLSRRFAPEEREWLQGLPEKGRPGAFFDLWAVKEAVLKATGQGLAGGNPAGVRQLFHADADRGLAGTILIIKPRRCPALQLTQQGGGISLPAADQAFQLGRRLTKRRMSEISL